MSVPERLYLLQLERESHSTILLSSVKHRNKLGVTVVVAAGNDSLDLNSPENAQIVNLNADCKAAVVVSATGPKGWAIDPGTSLYEQASYSNYGFGSGAIDFAGPGGNFDLAATAEGQADCTVVTGVGPITVPCFVFDLVFAPAIFLQFGDVSIYDYAWSAGTSMAAPAVAAVAALLMEEAGGNLTPAQVKALLRRRALDLGKPGRDELYGHGHVYF